MSDPKAQSNEPTMEEILASIRRIISENDEEQEKKKVDTQPPPPSAPEPEPAPAPAGVAVLELTEMVTEDGSVISLNQPQDEQPQDEQPQDETQEAAPSEAVNGVIHEPGITEVEDISTGEDIGSIDEQAGKAEIPMTDPKDDSVEFAPSTGQTSRPASAQPDEGLVSAAAAAAATATFAELARSMAQEPSTSNNMGLGSGRTLEDLVKEMLRPMLKDWLDRNLPTLVEHAVRRELDRMTRKAEGV